MTLDWPSAAVIIGVIAAIFSIVYKIITTKVPPKTAIAKLGEFEASLNNVTRLALLEQDQKNLTIRYADLRTELEKISVKVDKQFELVGTKFDQLNNLIREFMREQHKP